VNNGDMHQGNEKSLKYTTKNILEPILQLTDVFIICVNQHRKVQKLGLSGTYKEDSNF